MKRIAWMCLLGDNRHTQILIQDGEVFLGLGPMQYKAKLNGPFNGTDEDIQANMNGMCFESEELERMGITEESVCYSYFDNADEGLSILLVED